jgi:hypothetical protein
MRSRLSLSPREFVSPEKPRIASIPSKATAAMSAAITACDRWGRWPARPMEDAGKRDKILILIWRQKLMRRPQETVKHGDAAQATT